LTRKTSLTELRNEITRVTLEITRLCGERLQLAKSIGEIKARENLPVESPKFEEDLRSEVLSICQTYGLDRGFCLKLLDLLLDESKRVQRDLLGPKTRNMRGFRRYKT